VKAMSDQEEKKLLLVVDDNPSHIHMVHSILKDDYKIRIATNGGKALDLSACPTAESLYESC
jgi:response regulator RpfG family c-di-GMP phosphodiesterase